jgi:uncharacterized protein (UPF0332 family)
MSENFLNRARQAAQSARTLLSLGDQNGAVNCAYCGMFYAAQAMRNEA